MPIKRMKQIFYLLLIGSLCGACEKISDEPYFDTTPNIQLIEMIPDTIRQFDDQLQIRIAYEDGDGDLGSTDADVNSLFIKDERLEEMDAYYVGPLAPPGSTISIHGELDIQLGTFFLLGNAAFETTRLTIYMVDRAGHESNRLETGKITILRD